MYFYLTAATGMYSGRSLKGKCFQCNMVNYLFFPQKYYLSFLEEIFVFKISKYQCYHLFNDPFNVHGFKLTRGDETRHEFKVKTCSGIENKIGTQNNETPREQRGTTLLTLH